MPIVVPDAGEERMLDLILAVNMTMRLYRNDATAGLTAAQIEALTESDFTEANFTGYSAKALTGGSWTSTQDDPSTGTYAQQTWTRSATGTAQTIYGYSMHRTSDNALMWFEDFTGPITVDTSGDTIVVTPTITLDDDQEATVSARGVIGTPFSSTSSSSTYTSTGASDMSIASVPIDTTRVYRVHLHSAWGVSAAARWLIELQENSVTIARMDDTTDLGSATSDVSSVSVLWYPTTATPTIRVYLTKVSGGNFNFQGGAALPRYFWVEDAGAR